jgi:hypothetical protein
MKNRKLVTIDIETESNVGVIDLGDLRDVHQDKFSTYLTDKVEERLVEALQQHFDCSVRVRVPANIKTFHPITIEYIVVVCSEGGDYQETVTLNETYIY